MIQLQDIATQEVKSYVNAYLMAQIRAETIREKVNVIQRDILSESPLSPGELAAKCKHTEPITDPKYIYLCDDQAQLADYFAEASKREREAGLKPDEMPDEHCPALVAEHFQTEVENMLIKAAGKPLGIDHLYGELRKRFLDLVVRLVVNLPDFRNPLTGQPV